MTQSPPITRLFVPTALAEGAQIALDGPAAHKLRAVLRAKIGDTVLLFNGRDGEWLARLERVGKSVVDAEVLKRTREQRPEAGPWLAFAPIKKDRLDAVIEKAVELGVERLIPVFTQRTENRRVKLERLNQQAVQAAEQCERLTVPTINAPIELADLTDHWAPGRTLLICAERQDAPTLPEAVCQGPGPWGLLVGPEGGFRLGELDALMQCDWTRAVNLGPRILRAETAVIAGLSVLQATTGDWGGKTSKTPTNG